MLEGSGETPTPDFTDGPVEVYATEGLLSGESTVADAVGTLLGQIDAERGYLAVMAYLDRAREAHLAHVREHLAERTGRPTTFGWGPRFLHSTGQYHKGGPATGVYLQITAEPRAGPRDPRAAVHLRWLHQRPGDRGRLCPGRPRAPRAPAAPHRPEGWPARAARGARVTTTGNQRAEWSNPLRDPDDRRLPRIAGPCGMVLFGVTGDLSRKKVMPAIYDLANRGLLPPGFSLVGYARRDWAHQDFAQIVHDSVREHARTEFREEVWRQLAEGFRFVPGDFGDDADFGKLRRTIEELDEVRGTGGNHAFYLSIPPKFFGPVIDQLEEHGLADGGDSSWRRVVVEKPFGHDLESARELNAIIDRVFPPESVFRIDHYLGKETVQNILAMRFANNLFEPIWNANYVDHVQITMAEDIGIGGRAGLLRRHRRRPRRDPEPPAPADGARRDGGADLVRRGEPADREAEGAVVRRTPPAAGPDHRPRAVRRRLGRRREGQRLPRRGGHQADLDHRDLRRRPARRGDPPLGRGAVLPAHRQAAGPPGHRGGGGLQAGAAPAVHGRPRPRTSPTTRSCSGSSPTRAPPSGSARRCPAARWRSAT